jgi:hypothetical protein
VPRYRRTEGNETSNQLPEIRSENVHSYNLNWPAASWKEHVQKHEVGFLQEPSVKRTRELLWEPVETSNRTTNKSLSLSGTSIKIGTGK